MRSIMIRVLLSACLLISVPSYALVDKALLDALSSHPALIRTAASWPKDYDSHLLFSVAGANGCLYVVISQQGKDEFSLFVHRLTGVGAGESDTVVFWGESLYYMDRYAYKPIPPHDQQAICLEYAKRDLQARGAAQIQKELSSRVFPPQPLLLRSMAILNVFPSK